MKEILFVNACVREEESRTLKLAQTFLEGYQRAHPEDHIIHRNLMKDRLSPLYPETLAEQHALEAAGKLDQPMFEAARQFVAADKIVIAAPFWELSFPAILRIYLERISVVNLTFGYGPEGEHLGFCKAEKMLLITTRGGDFTGEQAWMEMGARQLNALCHMFGIGGFQCLSADGLDDVKNDPEAILAKASQQAEALATEF
ncbi:MAG: flavodoxin [Oscillospiraceae bacterium]|nr:flavodoxin [Oscillospiraceae bacterium]